MLLVLLVSLLAQQGFAQTDPCQLSEWSPFGACSYVNSVCVQSRVRTIGNASEIAANCPELTQAQNCSSTQCPINCVVSAWSAWSPCSVSCGGTGSQSRVITILQTPNALGTPCPTILSQTQTCGQADCPNPYLSTSNGNINIWVPAGQSINFQVGTDQAVSVDQIQANSKSYTDQSIANYDAVAQPRTTALISAALMSANANSATIVSTLSSGVYQSISQAISASNSGIMSSATTVSNSVTAYASVTASAAASSSLSSAVLTSSTAISELSAAIYLSLNASSIQAASTINNVNNLSLTVTNNANTVATQSISVRASIIATNNQLATLNMTSATMSSLASTANVYQTQSIAVSNTIASLNTLIQSLNASTTASIANTNGIIATQSMGNYNLVSNTNLVVATQSVSVFNQFSTLNYIVSNQSTAAFNALASTNAILSAVSLQASTLSALTASINMTMTLIQQTIIPVITSINAVWNTDTSITVSWSLATTLSLTTYTIDMAVGNSIIYSNIAVLSSGTSYNFFGVGNNVTLFGLSVTFRLTVVNIGGKAVAVAAPLSIPAIPRGTTFSCQASSLTFVQGAGQQTLCSVSFVLNETSIVAAGFAGSAIATGTLWCYSAVSINGDNDIPGNDITYAVYGPAHTYSLTMTNVRNNRFRLLPAGTAVTVALRTNSASTCTITGAALWAVTISAPDATKTNTFNCQPGVWSVYQNPYNVLCRATFTLTVPSVVFTYGGGHCEQTSAWTYGVVTYDGDGDTSNAQTQSFCPGHTYATVWNSLSSSRSIVMQPGTHTAGFNAYSGAGSYLNGAGVQGFFMPTYGVLTNFNCIYSAWSYVASGNSVWGTVCSLTYNFPFKSIVWLEFGGHSMNSAGGTNNGATFVNSGASGSIPYDWGTARTVSSYWESFGAPRVFTVNAGVNTVGFMFKSSNGASGAFNGGGLTGWYIASL